MHDASSLDLDRLLRHQAWLRRLAARLVGEGAADDLVQETWLAAMNRPPDPARPVKPWLAGVVRRLAKMRARGEGRRTYRQQAASKKDELPSTAELIEGIDSGRRLAEAVTCLAEPYRTTVLLRYYEGLSAAEIARRQDLPAGTVRWRLKKGLDELRGELDREWGGREAWCLAFLPLARGPVEQTAAVSTVATSVWLRVAGVLLFLSLMIALRPMLSTRGVEGLVAEAPNEQMEDDLALGAAMVTESSSPERSSKMRASVAVREFTGEALAYQLAAIIDVHGHAYERETDGEGVMDVEGLEGPGVLWIQRPGSFVTRVEVKLSGEEQIELERGERFGGRITGNGQPVALELALDYDALIYPRPVPQSVKAILGHCRRADVASDADGYFAFHGLPAGWSGEFWTPVDWVSVAFDGHPVPASQRMHVERASDVAHVEALRLPRVHGAVTRGGRPLAEEDIRARFPGCPAVNVRTDELGQFVVWAPVDEVSSVALEVAGRRLKRTFEPVSYGDEVDLAIVELHEGGELVPVRVVGEGEELIPSAKATLASRDTFTVNGDGLIEVFLLEGTKSVEFSAPGWRTRELEVDELQATPVIYLQRNARVTITCRDRDGDYAERLRFRAHGDLFEPGHRPAELAGEVRVSDDLNRMFSDARGRLELEGLRPGIEFDLIAIDSLGREIGTQRITSPVGYRDEQIEFDLDCSLEDLTGVVTDQEGQVLLGVEVELFGRGKPMRRRSGDQGVFVAKAIGPEPFDIELRKSGYAPVRLTGATASGIPSEFELASGRDLLMTVLDESGNPVQDAALSAMANGVSWDASPVASGIWRLADLPHTPVELALVVDGATFAPLDAVRDAQTFQLQGRARLSLRMRAPGELRVTVESEDGSFSSNHPLEERLTDLGRFPAGTYRLKIERALSASAGGGWQFVREEQVVLVPGEDREVTLR